MVTRKKRIPWNKDFTKESNLSVKKISETMKKRKIDNFHTWREKMKRDGFIKNKYKKFTKNNDLAELIGVVLGDGHIEKFPRTERLTISSNSANKGFINRYRQIISRIFSKEPYCEKIKNINCIRISIYEKKISERLAMPTGNRAKKHIKIPSWILNNKKLLLSYLRGLYEAEGSFCIHKPTCTYKFLFSKSSDKNAKIRSINFSIAI